MLPLREGVYVKARLKLTEASLGTFKKSRIK